AEVHRSELNQSDYANHHERRNLWTGSDKRRARTRRTLIRIRCPKVNWRGGELERESDQFFFFSSRRRHTRWPRDWSSDVCSSDLFLSGPGGGKGASDCGPSERNDGGHTKV